MNLTRGRKDAETLRHCLAVILSVFAASCFADVTNRASLKLSPVPACPSLVAAAQSNHISLDQFDSAPGTNALEGGDSATVLVTFTQKQKQTQWLLCWETIAPDPKKVPEKKPSEFVVSSSFGPPEKFKAKFVPAKLRLLGPFATSGTKQPKVEDTRAEFELNEGFLSIGMDQPAALLWRWSQQTNFNGAVTSKALLAMKPTPTEQRAMCGTFPALLSYVEIVQNTDGLESLFFKLVDLPSVWSVVRHLGVTANLSFGNKALPSPANPADWNLPTNAPVYYFPFLLRLNDQPSLKITLVVTNPRQPLLICGGVVGLLAEKVGDEQTYMSMRLVSANTKAAAGSNAQLK